MKLALINPPTLQNVRNVGRMKPSLPLGLAYIAGAARRAGHEVVVVDAITLAPRETWRDEALFRIGADVPEIVAAVPADVAVIGIGCLFSFIWPFVRDLVKALRARFPSVPLVCGGEHASGLPERCLREAPLDFVVVGEGEETFVALLAAIGAGAGDLESIAGLALRRADGSIFQTRRRPRLRDLDDLAAPAWDLFRVDVYDEHEFSHGVRLGRAMPILATRGCPYHCTYCSSPNMWSQRWTPRDPVRVVDEIESNHRRYGATSFPFCDLTAVIRRRWIVEFCTELLRRGLPITWQLASGTRCEAFDAEMASLMYRSGCRYLAFAPESGSERVRHLVHKRLETKDLFAAVDVAVAAGIRVTCFFMMGLPFETRDDLRETVALARALAQHGVEDVSCGFFHPVPGTPLYDELVARHRIAADDDRALMAGLLGTDMTLRDENNYCDAIPARGLSRWRLRLFGAFYGARFASHPDAALSLAVNLLLGRETNKVEAAVRELRLKLRLRGDRRPPRKTRHAS